MTLSHDPDLTGVGIAVREQSLKRRFHGLDGARGIAALAVLTVHWDRLLQPVVFIGAQRAVDLFFMMSGFVIALNYDARLIDDLSPGRFIFKRIIRLWPLHLLGTLLVVLGIAAAIVGHARVFWTWPELALFAICNILMLPGPPDLHAGFALFPLNGPSWSLFWEIAVNYVYALTRRHLTNATLATIACISALFLLTSIVYYGNGSGGFDWLSIPQGLCRVNFGFFTGVLLFRWHAEGRLARIVVPTWLALLAIAAVLWVPTIGGSRMMADAVLVLVALPILVAALVESEPRRGARLCTFLGLISYPVYALHFAFGKYAEGIAEKVGRYQVTDYAPGIGLALLLALVAVCTFLDRVYDQPVRCLLMRWIAKVER